MFANKSVEVRIKGARVKIHAISTGMVSVKTKLRESSKKGLLAKLDFIFDKTFTEWMPIWGWAIEHPDGIYIVDTGANANVNNPAISNHPECSPIGSILKCLNSLSIGSKKLTNNY
jgi:N-acyl homoserine lactone hydrolase